jgi:hypothetical protein
MKRSLKLAALLLALAGTGFWLAKGAHRGWTQTSVPVKTMDAVTGIEAVEYQKQFVPGIEILGGIWLLSAAMAGASWFCKSKTRNVSHEN